MNWIMTTDLTDLTDDYRTNNYELWIDIGPRIKRITSKNYEKHRRNSPSPTGEGWGEAENWKFRVEKQ